MPEKPNSEKIITLVVKLTEEEIDEALRRALEMFYENIADDVRDKADDRPR